jgi:hypothetical protein
MKKLGAFSFAAFYLLLTTGVYVCLLHCSAEYFLAPPIITTNDHHDDHAGHDQHHQKKPCKGGNCDCCNKHGSYVIKENISTSANFYLTAPSLPAFTIIYQPDGLVAGFRTVENTWPSTGPPGSYKPPFYIINHSFLI